MTISAPTENGKKVLTMTEYFAGGHLRFVDGEWRDDDGNMIEVYRVRHGRWVDRIVDDNEVIQPWMQRYYCSECLGGGSRSWFKFCPNCGAKMDGGDNE